MKPIDFTAEELSSDSRLRIAVVTETYPPEVNGVAMSLKRMVDGLIDRGHQVQLIRPRQTSSDHGATRPEFEELLARGWKLPRYDGLRFGLPARAALTRTWSRRSPDLVHVATEGPLGWTAVSAAARLRLPVTSDFHTNFDHYSRYYGVAWLKQPVTAYLRKFHNRTAATFVPTDALALALKHNGYRNVEVVARGVDTVLFSPAHRSERLRDSWGLAPDELAVIHVGRIAPEKNLQLLFRAFQAIRALEPQARLILVGDGPMREALQREYPEAVFTGMQTGQALAEHYASSDLFLFPSLTETFGNVTLEALASGLPMLAYDYAAAAQIIDSENNGVVVPEGDEDTFVSAAVRLASDPALRRILAAGARETATRYDWDEVNDCFEGRLMQVWQAANPGATCVGEGRRAQRRS